MQVSLIKNVDLVDISKELLMTNDKIRLLPSDHYKNYKWESFRIFCHQYARYGIPTVELVNFIKGVIGDRSAIEIGSGAGDLGFHLKIKMTDSKQQENPDIISIYKAMGQPVIKYPDDVEKLDAVDAVYKYKPKVVIASWITPYSPAETTFGSNPHGVKEDKILNLVDTFVIIGNLDTHHDKPILKHTHKIIQAPWIISRAINPEKNCVFIWDKNDTK